MRMFISLFDLALQLADVVAEGCDEVCHLCEGDPGVAPKPGDHAFQIERACPVCGARGVGVLAGLIQNL